MSNRRRTTPLLSANSADRTRTSPPPGSVTGSSGSCGWVNASRSRTSLRVGRGLSTGGLLACGRGVAQLGGLDLGGPGTAASEPRAAGALGLADRLLGHGERLDELDDRHGGVVALARTDLGDARVAAGAVLVPRTDLGEQGVDDVLVPDHRHDLAA